MAIVIDNKYEIGETVYLKTDKEQLPRIVYCIKKTKLDVLYEIACGTITSSHYDFEVSTEKDTVLASQ